ncbi:tetratricopeptide repeat protein [Sphingopyxis indica]|nr:tetratricopeptide repeat protein [Sphingopyxis indica]
MADMTSGRLRTGALLAALLLAGCGGREAEAPRAALERQRAELTRYVADHPEAVRERAALARVAMRLGDSVTAEAAVEEAIAAGGAGEVLRPLLARAYAMQGEGDRAIATLDAGPIAPEMLGEAAWVEANVRLDRGDLEGARKAFDLALRERPREAGLWADVARFRAANADARGARQAVDHAIELDAGNGAALALKADLVRDQQGLAPALAWYDRALAADPGNADAWIERAATLGDLGRYREMLASLRRAATLTPGEPRLFYLQAVLAARAGNYRLARSLLQRTRGQLDDEPGFMLVSAIAELQLGGQALAATWAERLVEVQPHNFTVRRLLAAANWADADDEGAAAALAPIVARADADSWSLLLAARVAAEQGDGKGSAAYQDRAARLARGAAAPFTVDDDPLLVAMAAEAAPLDPSKVIPAIAADVMQGNGARALERAARLRDANPGVADAHRLFGDAALAEGRLDLAVAAFRKARNLDAGEGAALRLADALLRSGDSAGAAAAVAALRESDPSSIAADRFAGRLALDRRRWDAAIAAFERVRRRLGDRDAVILRDLAHAWAGKGEAKRALPLAARAYRLQPLNCGIMLLYADLLEAQGDAANAAALRDKAAQAGR